MMLLNTEDTSIWNFLLHVRNFGWGGGWEWGGIRKGNTRRIFLYLRIDFFATDLKRGKWQETGLRDGVEDGFKPIFSLFLAWLLRKLQFLIPMVDFAPPPISAPVL